MNKIILFGAGGHADYLWEQIWGFPYFSDKYVAFSDNNSKLWGEKFKGLDIIPPYELNRELADFFVITSIYYKEIKKQLVNETDIPESRIFTFDEYKRKCFTQWQYFKRYGNLMADNKKHVGFNMKKMVIYTAITGEYDNLHDPLFVDKNLTYVCFTNNKKIKSDIWNIEYIHDDKLDHTYLSKKIKLFPDLYLKEYDTSIWVDGKLGIKEDIRNYVIRYERDKSILCFPHYERECIYEEAGVCLHYKKGNKNKIIRQMSDYYQNGYPINNGLYEMACIVRQHNDALVRKIMTDWYQEIRRYSHRDQISFPVVCYNNNFLPDICDLDIYNNRWLTVYEHTYKE